MHILTVRQLYWDTMKDNLNTTRNGQIATVVAIHYILFCFRRDVYQQLELTWKVAPTNYKVDLNGGNYFDFLHLWDTPTTGRNTVLDHMYHPFKQCNGFTLAAHSVWVSIVIIVIASDKKNWSNTCTLLETFILTIGKYVKKQQKVVDEVALNIDYKFAFPNRGPSAMGHLAVVLDKVCFRCTSTKRVV